MCVSVMMDTVPFPLLMAPSGSPLRGLEPNNILLERSRERVCVCVHVCVRDCKRAKSPDEAVGSQNKGLGASAAETLKSGSQSEA